MFSVALNHESRVKDEILTQNEYYWQIGRLERSNIDRFADDWLREKEREREREREIDGKILNQ